MNLRPDRRIAVLLLFAAWPLTAAADGAAVRQARAELLDVLAAYAPGAAPDEAFTARVDTAARELERAAGPPDLRVLPDRAAGLWRTLFSSQGVFGEVDLAFMTRALPGGGAAGGTARIEQVLQELRPSDGFYRNTMVMRVGPEGVPALYFATADLAIAETPPNALAVRFRRIEFVPARADIPPAVLREALGLPPDTPLALTIPRRPDVRASISKVTYLGERLRINRGDDYVAVLERVR